MQGLLWPCTVNHVALLRARACARVQGRGGAPAVRVLKVKDKGQWEAGRGAQWEAGGQDLNVSYHFQGSLPRFDT